MTDMETGQIEFSIFRHHEVDGLWHSDHPGLAEALDGFNEGTFIDKLAFEDPNLVWFRKPPNIVTLQERLEGIQAPSANAARQLTQQAFEQGFAVFCPDITMASSVVKVRDHLSRAIGLELRAFGFLTPPHAVGTEPHTDNYNGFLVVPPGNNTKTLLYYPSVVTDGGEDRLVDVGQTEPVVVEVKPGQCIFAPSSKVPHTSQAPDKATLHIGFDVQDREMHGATIRNFLAQKSGGEISPVPGPSFSNPTSEDWHNALRVLQIRQ